MWASELRGVKGGPIYETSSRIEGTDGIEHAARIERADHRTRCPRQRGQPDQTRIGHNAWRVRERVRYLRAVSTRFTQFSRSLQLWTAMRET